jgi:hypothetical protein
MDVGGIRDLVRRPSRRAMRLGATAALVLAVPIVWSVRQSRLTHEALERATAAEKHAAEARSDVELARARLKGEAPIDPSVRRSRHDDAREIERVKQLYQEIDNLSQSRDEVDQSLRTERFYVPKAPKR